MARRPADKAHAKRAHADISPSGAERWWNCPGSVALIAQLKPERTTNIWSEQGTAAHELLEKALSAGRAPIAYLGQVVNKPSKQAIGQVITVDRSMAASVEEAIDYINSFRRKGDTILTEKELDIPATGQPGHVDVAIFCPSIIDVFDYKNGTNPVEVKGNKQAKLYALGVLEYIRKHHPKHLTTIRKVRIHIVQPRSRLADITGPADKETITLPELMKFSVDTKKKVAEIRAGGAPLCPGEVQCYYCPVKAQCPALAKKAVEAARMDFMSVVSKPTPPKIVTTSLFSKDLMDNSAIGNALTALPLMELWMCAVREFAARESMAGRRIPGWKVVEGKSNRRWEDEGKVIKEFKKLGVKEDDFMPRKLVGLGAANDLLPKDKREPFFKKLCVKPKGSPSLVPESDPRPTYNRADGAKIDFAEDLT